MNVRISEEAHAVLRGLAAQEGHTMQAVLDEAIETYRRARFWEEVNAAGLTLHHDPAAWQEELDERRAWEATLSDGLEA